MSADTGSPISRTHWLIWVFAAIGVLGIIGILALVAMVYDFSRPYQPPKVAGRTAEESFVVRSVGALPGTDLLQMEVGIIAPSGSYSGGGSDVRNILLLDRKTGASRRLLPDNSRRIRQSRFLPARAEPGASAPDELSSIDGGRAEGEDRLPPAYYLLEVARERDRGVEDVLVGRLGDGRQAIVMTGIDGIDLSWMDSPTRLGLIVREKLRLYYRIVDIPSLKVVENRPIAID
jgi:hypothetical protein